MGSFFFVLYPDQREVRAFSILSPSLYGGQAVSGHSSLPVWPPVSRAVSLCHVALHCGLPLWILHQGEMG